MSLRIGIGKASTPSAVASRSSNSPGLEMSTTRNPAAFNARSRPLLSRWSGLLFSAGHGVVVTAVAIVVATVAMDWTAPEWLGDAGTWISIGFLLLLGVANLGSVCRSPRGEALAPAGLRTRLFERLTRAGFTYAVDEFVPQAWRPPVAGSDTPFPGKALVWSMTVRAWRGRRDA